MKFLLLALVTMCTFTLNAQMDVYMKDIKLHFPEGAVCELETDECEVRVSLKVNGKRVAIIGRDGSRMTNLIPGGKSVNYFTENLHEENKNEIIYVGKYKRNETFNVVFDIWEDDGCGDNWTFSTECWINDDDEHPDTEITANLIQGITTQNPINVHHNKKAKGCVEVAYKLVTK